MTVATGNSNNVKYYIKKGIECLKMLIEKKFQMTRQSKETKQKSIEHGITT